MTSPEAPGTPSRPARPAYGEYAEPGDPRFAAPAAAPAAPAPVEQVARPRRRDWIASSILLALGFLSTVNAVIVALSLEDALKQMYAFYGGTDVYTPAGNLDLARWVIIVSHVVLFAATLLVTRALAAAGRLSFWVPLVGGAVAGIIYVATVTALLLGDPALLDLAMKFGAG